MLPLPCETEDASNGWLLSSSTAIISKMNLNKPLPIEPLPRKTYIPRKAVKQHTSIPSESSIPSLMEDSFGWSDSDVSFEDQHHYSSEEDLWDSFWMPSGEPGVHQARIAPQPARIPLCTPPKKMQKVRKQAWTIPEPIAPVPKDLHRSDAIRVANRAALTPFPPTQQPPLPRSQVIHVPHKSLPPRLDSLAIPQRPLMRSRAYTTKPCTPPSPLSNCTTISPSTSSSTMSTPPTQYASSAPVSPQYPPPVPLMDLMEKSVFEDYDDEDEEQDSEKTGLVALAEKLHLRKSSGNNSEAEEVEKREARGRRRNASEVLKGVFGMKK